ncbi:MAG: hypothetical protein FJ318_08535 [SAR202 cluster bacterium]|nr:hypothetical protein [SAR202 cluster bacterium]
MFAGVPDDEVRAMLGENALRVYRFDEAKVRAHAERIGPPAGTFGETPPIDNVAYARLWRESAAG